jgi:predicted metal-dependent phosphoesterase TrpH
MLTADLHIHTEFSPDGEFGTKQILKDALQENLTILSITDHNTVKGISPALKDASGSGIKIIPGIELDCVFKGIDLHMLGYNINWKGSDFEIVEKQVGEKMMNAFSLMIENLKPFGIFINHEDLISGSDGRFPSAEMIAEYLLSNHEYDNLSILDPYRPEGKRSDMPYLNFYLDFFAQGKPAYVKIDFMDYGEAISMIMRNDGIPIVAHPGHNLKGREEMVAELLEQGAKGLEVFNNYHSPKQMEMLAEVAIRKNVLMTCGSDFHGKNKPTISLGQFKTIERLEGYVNESVEELLC